MKKTSKKSIAAVLILCLCFGVCLSQDSRFQASIGIGNGIVNSESIIGPDYALCSTSPLATAAGEEILKNGGNAVDAAVAIAMVLAVVEPYASGLGGGGYMLIYDPSTGLAKSIDYYAASGQSEIVTGEIGVPGFLKGQQYALEGWGTKTLSEVMNPAVQYATQGFSASKQFINRVNNNSVIMEDDIFKDIKEGDVIVQEELGSLMKSIQENGIDAFYSGDMGQAFASASGLTLEDLKNYQVYEEDAISTEAFGCKLYGTAAPSSAITTLQIVSMAEKVSLVDRDIDLSSYLTGMQNITRMAYRVRSKTLVDPRLYNFDAEYLLSDAYIDGLLGDGTYAAYDADPERTCTTQFSVIDSNGLTVCVTNTLSDNWGSTVNVSGVYLNNTLSLFGLSDRLSYEPNKRPRTHLSPVIAVNSDGSILAVGSPGGVNIPQVVASVLIDILQNGEDVRIAIDKPRIVFDEDNKACIEIPDDPEKEVSPEMIPMSYYYSYSHLFFGCTSIVGYNSITGVFSYGDIRRLNSTRNPVDAIFGK